MGLLYENQFPGVLLALGVSSLILLSSTRADRNLLTRNRFLRVYIIILLLTVLTFDAEVFVLVNGVDVFNFARSQDALQKFVGMWGRVLGATSMVITLLADGVLVCLLLNSH